MGPKSENVERVLVFKAFLKGSKGRRGRQDGIRMSQPDRPGGGRGRVNPPPMRLVWRFWEVWRVDGWFGRSTRLEARGLGGLTLSWGNFSIVHRALRSRSSITLVNIFIRTRVFVIRPNKRRYTKGNQMNPTTLQQTWYLRSRSLLFPGE